MINIFKPSDSFFQRVFSRLHQKDDGRNISIYFHFKPVNGKYLVRTEYKSKYKTYQKFYLPTMNLFNREAHIKKEEVYILSDLNPFDFEPDIWKNIMDVKNDFTIYLIPNISTVVKRQGYSITALEKYMRDQLNDANDESPYRLNIEVKHDVMHIYLSNYEVNKPKFIPPEERPKSDKLGKDGLFGDHPRKKKKKKKSGYDEFKRRHAEERARERDRDRDARGDWRRPEERNVVNVDLDNPGQEQDDVFMDNNHRLDNPEQEQRDANNRVMFNVMGGVPLRYELVHDRFKYTDMNGRLLVRIIIIDENGHRRMGLITPTNYTRERTRILHLQYRRNNQHQPDESEARGYVSMDDQNGHVPIVWGEIPMSCIDTVGGDVIAQTMSRGADGGQMVHGRMNRHQYNAERIRISHIVIRRAGAEWDIHMNDGEGVEDGDNQVDVDYDDGRRGDNNDGYRFYNDDANDYTDEELDFIRGGANNE